MPNRPVIGRSVLVLGCLALVACDAATAAPSASGPGPANAAFAEPTSAAPPAVLRGTDPVGDPARGRALAARYECSRCHDGAGLTRPPLDRSCVRCHTDVLAGRIAAPQVHLARWQRHIQSLVAVPSLDGAARLRRSWVSRFLLDPVDLRPGLRATMPRLALDPQQAADLAAFLVPVEPGPPEPPLPRSAGALAEGLSLLGQMRCLQCHAFGDEPAVLHDEAAAIDVVRLAPDLSLTRDRMSSSALVRFLDDPMTFDPDARMPQFPLTRDQRRLLASALAYAERPRAPPPPVDLEIPSASPRTVRFSEVADRVLRRTCWHCHGDPDFAYGDGGPGNTGGFGFPARRLRLTDATGVRSGSVDDAGARRSVFRSVPLGRSARTAPMLVAVLLARRAEEGGARVAGVRGMPLGLPSLSTEDIRLVVSWIAQGRPE